MLPMPRPVSIRAAAELPSIRKLFTCTGSLTRKMPGSSLRVANQFFMIVSSLPCGLADLSVLAHGLERGRVGEQPPQHQRGDLVAELRRSTRAAAAVEGQRPDQDAGDGLPGQRRV